MGPLFEPRLVVRFVFDLLGRISLVLVNQWMEPYSNRKQDIDAAEWATQFMLGWFANPIFVNGDYPEVMKEVIGRQSSSEGRNESRLPEFTREEKARINGS